MAEYSFGVPSGCPKCEGKGVDPDAPERECDLCGGSGDYPGVANAWGQYGVSEVYVDVDAEDESETPRKLVCMNTFMCETALTVAGARQLIDRLYRAIVEIEGMVSSDQWIAAQQRGERFLEDVREQLGPRAYNCLRRGGILTVEQTRARSDVELLAISNLGVTTLARIRQVCGGGTD